MLTSAEKISFLRRLGWPADVLTKGTLTYARDIDMHINNFSKDVVDQVKRFLAILDDIDNRLRGVDGLNRTQAGSLEGVQLNPDERFLLRSEKRSVIYEMSTLCRLGPPQNYGVRYW